jgi:two-component system, NtrC family, response regulator GlrR
MWRVEWSDQRGHHDAPVSHHAVVGSMPGVSIVVDDPSVAHLHVELLLRGGVVWVRSLGSDNPTSLNGSMVEVAEWQIGRDLLLGNVTVALRVSAEPNDRPPPRARRFGPLLGRSEAMQFVFAQLSQTALGSGAVLVQGEAGTGKTLAAHALHDASAGTSQPFVVVRCGCVERPKLEEEIFGLRRNSITGHSVSHDGGMGRATGGTLLLEGADVLPLRLQALLLLAVERGRFCPVGGGEYVPFNARLVLETSQDLRTLVNRHGFREDFYRQLAEGQIFLPSLSERQGDIPLLAKHFAKKSLTPPDLESLLSCKPHLWADNVRGLREYVESRW